MTETNGEPNDAEARPGGEIGRSGAPGPRAGRDRGWAPEAHEQRGRPRGGRRLRRFTLAALAAAAGALALVVGAANLVVARAARGHIQQDARALQAALAIVPGASVYRDGKPSPQLEDRLVAALALVRAGRVQRVLVSGARNGAYDEAGSMRRWLIHRGVPPAAVAADHAGFRTLDTMERAARVFGVRSAVVCTQSFHLARAVFLARRAGIDAAGLVADGERGGVNTGDHVREAFATAMAVLDSYLLRRQARVMGPPLPPSAIDSDP